MGEAGEVSRELIRCAVPRSLHSILLYRPHGPWTHFKAACEAVKLVLDLSLWQPFVVMLEEVSRGDQLEGYCSKDGDVTMACATNQSEDKSLSHCVPQLAPLTQCILHERVMNLQRDLWKRHGREI